MSTTHGGQGLDPQRLEELRAFLDTAPASLQGWAREQRHLAEQAVGTAPVHDAGVAQDFQQVGIDEDELPLATADSSPAPKTAASTAPVTMAAQRPGRRPGWVLPVSLAALSALVVGGVFYLSPQPATTGTAPAASSSAVAISTPKPPDPAMVKALEDKVKANPKDTMSMKALGEVYGTAEMFDEAAAWQQRVVDVDPTDVDGWMALGVAQFNGNKLPAAEKSWNKARSLSPKRAEVYYNLGFLYYSQGKQDQASAAWQKVVDLDPRSDLAQTVKSHIKAQSSTAATPSATPSR